MGTRWFVKLNMAEFRGGLRKGGSLGVATQCENKLTSSLNKRPTPTGRFEIHGVMALVEIVLCR
jgi:hypothetical protein